MAKDVKTRIEERNRLADYHREKQGPIGRAVSGAGLALANGWDRVTSPFKKDGVVFGGMSAFGAIRGGMWGAVAGVAAGLFFAGGVATGVLVPYILTAAAVGAVAGGIQDGQRSFERHLDASNHQFADTIAEKTGAVPGREKLRPVAKTVEAQLKLDGFDPKMVKRAEAAEEAVKNNPSFVERENKRRASRTGPTVLNP